MHIDQSRLIWYLHHDRDREHSPNKGNLRHFHNILRLLLHNDVCIGCFFLRMMYKNLQNIIKRDNPVEDSTGSVSHFEFDDALHKCRVPYMVPSYTR